jgi:SAM-dependent methyltransferase
MFEILKNIAKSAIEFGFDPRRFLLSLRGLPYFIADLRKYNRMLAGSANGMKIGAFYPILHDRFSSSGAASGHYFHQDLWAARKVFEKNPVRHIDIGSSVSGFVSSLLAFREVEVIDIRPNVSKVRGLKFIQADATDLRDLPDNSVESISTLHACEHFGLGRYGDPVDPDSHFKFMRALARVLKPGGRLYFALPSGQEKLYFNAHRVLSPTTVLGTFSDLKLVSFSCVKDDGDLYENCPTATVANELYGCGLYEFTK